MCVYIYAECPNAHGFHAEAWVMAKLKVTSSLQLGQPFLPAVWLQWGIKEINYPSGSLSQGQENRASSVFKINWNSAKECNQWLWRMTETPSLDHSRYKSDLEPRLLPYWAMCLHCLTQDPSADLMMAEAHSKTPGGLTGPQRLLCLH